MYGVNSVKLESLCIKLVKRFWFFDFLKQAMTLPQELEFQNPAIFSGHKKTPVYLYIFDYEFLAVEMQSQVQYSLRQTVLQRFLFLVSELIRSIKKIRAALKVIFFCQ